jgi:hypothetical protein
MARRKKRGERQRWKPKARRAGTHAFVYPTTEEEEAALPPPGGFAGKYKRGDKVRFHPAAKAMLAASPIPIDVNAVMTIERIVPREENVQADAEAAMLKLPSGMTTVAETDLLLPVGKNPRKDPHRDQFHAYYRQASASLRKGREVFPKDFKGAFNSALDAIKFAGMAKSEAENAGISGYSRDAQKLGHEAVEYAAHLLRVAQTVSVRLGKPLVNPADIPGGSMSACIEIMERRGDVESPGALCNWLAQRAGEYGGGVRMPSVKRKKMKPQTRSIMRRLMKGT